MSDTLRTYDWHVREDGDPTRPTILLLHGFTGCVEMWDDIVSGLAGSFHCLRVDLPGHGRTGIRDARETHTMPRVACDLIDLLDERGILKTSLWGYSMGGRLALLLAVTYPRRWDHVILESASPGIDDPVAREQRQCDDEALACEIVRIGVPEFIERWLAQPMFANQQTLPESRRELARRLRRMHTASGLASALRGLGVGAQSPLTNSLPALRSPVLILTGEQDAKFRAIGTAMTATIPRARMEIISGCGHAPHWENPTACLSAAIPFLLSPHSAPAPTGSGCGGE
ncbi:MAG: 2-succinyl-6-hydroxy-2,4-cyclohexadiene-1-carboxylate synthase [Candidatus Zixiibacteriota bacterium]